MKLSVNLKREETDFEGTNDAETETMESMESPNSDPVDPEEPPTSAEIVDAEDIVKSHINEDRDLENNHNELVDEEAETEEKPQLDYVGQGASDERARGSFDRDESVDGRHDVYDSPAEDHVEDHETEGHDLVALINEDRDMESVHEQKGDEVTDDDVAEGEKPELDYVGQGTGDERARGTFDRDESIEGRHDVFESPQEIHEEPDHEGLHDDDQEEEGDEEEEEEEEDTVDIEEEEETEDLVDDEETENLEVDDVEEDDEEEAVDEEETENLEIDDIEEETAEETVDEEETENLDVDDIETELVVVHDATKMERLSNHWMMSLVLLVVTGAALAVFFLHLMQRCNEQKVTKGYDPESTPLIADKV